MIEKYRNYTEFVIYVQYEWLGSPSPDYTLKVYSKHDLRIFDENDKENILYTDGRLPSEWTNSTYRGTEEMRQ